MTLDMLVNEKLGEIERLCREMRCVGQAVTEDKPGARARLRANLGLIRKTAEQAESLLGDGDGE